jgi:Schlafen, AlbA_2
MSGEVPLGRKEGQHLEFKAAAALERPDIIARSVGAMLNSEGGEVWIGLREEKGRAVVEEPIDRLSERQRSLRDYLLDTIEPPLRNEDFRVEPVGVKGDRGLLVVKLSRVAKRGPYCHVKSGGRFFTVRVGDRLRPMTRLEIAEAFREVGASESDRDRKLAEADARLAREEGALQGQAGELFRIRIQPIDACTIDLQGLGKSDYLTDARRSGNREAGFNFAHAYEASGRRPRPRTVAGRPEIHIGTAESAELSVFGDGGIVFAVPLASLEGWLSGSPNHLKACHLLHPISMGEYTASVFRLAAAVYSDPGLGSCDAGAPILARLAVFGLRDWVLLPGPFQNQLFNQHRAARLSASDYVRARSLVVSVDGIRNAPDRYAFRLLRDLYEAFGFYEEDLPPEFDRATGRLMLSE